MSEKCPKCNHEMIRDVPLGQVLTDAVGVLFNPFSAVTKSRTATQFVASGTKYLIIWE